MFAKTILTIAILLSPYQVIANDEVTDLSLEQLMNMEVFTASRFSQKSKEAPSSVTIITSEDIERYGYTKFSQILDSIRGLYTSEDRNYTYLGARGFSVSGDYNTRILALLDGHRINDNIYLAVGIGYDNIVNVDLIKRVEFAPGPGSAVYGSNAVFGVLNIITKNASDVNGTQTSVDYGSENSRRLRVSNGTVFDNSVEALFSASVYKSDGADLYFQEFDDPVSNFGVAEDLDYEESRNLFGKLQLADWDFSVAYNDRIKGIPTASFGQEFNQKPSETIDTLLLVSLDNVTQTKNGVLSSSLSYGQYDYSGDYIYDYPPITVNADTTNGKWWRLESRYQTILSDIHNVLIGAEYQNNTHQDQANFDADPLFFSYLDDKHDSFSYALYLQDEIRLSDQLILNIGLRHDVTDFGDDDGSETEQDSTNPRLALIYALQQETTLKFIYGTAFRNPNANELYYGAALGFLTNTQLRPEEVSSYEIDLEHFLSNNFKLTAAVFHNEITDLIDLETDINGDQFYDNLGESTSTGLELETEYIHKSGVRLRSSYSLTDAEDSTNGETLTNSPKHLVKFNMILPVFKRMADLGVEFQYISSRKTVSGGADIGGVSVTNLTLFSKKLFDQLDLSASIYNVFDKEYQDPGTGGHVQNGITQDGRSYRVKATYNF